MNENMKKIGVLVILLAAAFLVGRHTVPVKTVTKIEEKIVEKEVVKTVESSKKDEKRNKEVIIIETRLPDGTVKKETRIVDRGTIVIDSTKDSTRITSVETERKSETSTKANSQKWNVALLAAKKDTINSEILYGGHVQYKVAGPFSVGVMGLSNKTGAISVGVTY